LASSGEVRQQALEDLGRAPCASPTGTSMSRATTTPLRFGLVDDHSPREAAREGRP